MAGKVCPICGKATFFETASGRECSKCGAKMTVPPNNGRGGQGEKNMSKVLAELDFVASISIFNGR